jgi:glutathione synthase/RimK-type ligase-like ATP-grasp enzyme
MILLITSADDVHSDCVIAELERRGAQFCRFHPETILCDNALQFRCCPDSERWELESSMGRTVCLSEITSIYFRKPKPPRLNPQTKLSAQAFCEWESKYFIDSFLNFLHSLAGVTWVNDDRLIRFAEDKPAQLRIARQLGFRVPETLITSDPLLASEFCKRMESSSCGIITKAFISRGLPLKTVSYTYSLRTAGLDWDNVRVAPTMLQEYIPKLYDIRVTCINETIFAIRIDSQVGSEALVDFRAADLRQLAHSVVNLPSDIQERVRQLVATFGLIHAEIDMCLATNGDYVFFEMNPNGQWLWLELQTGAPIAATFADVLISNGSLAARSFSE